jgi:hypothetical protein
MARIGKDFPLVMELDLCQAGGIGKVSSYLMGLDVCQVGGIGKVASAPDLVQGFLP